jgi:hypothetical protein
LVEKALFFKSLLSGLFLEGSSFHEKQQKSPELWHRAYRLPNV